MTLILRSVKGSNLTPAEVDGNFMDHEDRIVAVETAVATPANPFDPDTPFIVTGDTFTIKMADATEFGPYPISVPEDNPRGPWAPLTIYAKRDTVIVNGKLYRVIFGHTSASTFDPGANDGMGHDYYSLLLDSFGVPHVSENAADTIDLTTAMANTHIECTSVDGAIINISLDFVTELALDAEIYFAADTDGIVSFFAQDDSDGAVTLKLRKRRLPELAGNGAVAMLKKIAATTMRLVGDLAADDSTDSV